MTKKQRGIKKLSNQIWGLQKERNLGAKAEPINADELAYTWSALIYGLWFGLIALDTLLLWLGDFDTLTATFTSVFFIHTTIMSLGILAVLISENRQCVFSRGLFYGLKRIGVTKGLVGHLTVLMLGAFASMTILHIIAFAQDNLTYLVVSFMAEFIFATSGAICIFTKKIVGLVKNRYEQRQVF